MLHQIGAGALGPVFRAYEPEPGRLVAVKLFRLDLPPERAYQLVTELERLVAADLSHPGIAAPIATGLADITPYLAQDFVTADSLDVIVRSGGSSSPAEVTRVASHIGAALDYAADRDVHHGALHPRDVMLSVDDVRITGLGVTRALQHVHISTPVRRPYSAPERAVGGPWDARADLFSFAALMFELLYGRRASGSGDRAVAAVPEIPGTSRAVLKRVFAKGLSADPGGRFASGTAFADALREALAPGNETALMPGGDQQGVVALGHEDVADAAPTSRRTTRKRAKPSEEFRLPESDPRPADERLSLPLEPAILDVGGAQTEEDKATELPVEELERLERAFRADIREEQADQTEKAADDVRSDRLVGASIADVEGAAHGHMDLELTPARHPHEGDVLDLPALRLPLDPAHERPENDGADTTRGADMADAHAADDERFATRVAGPTTFASQALETTRSAIWPIPLALVVGAAIGFGIAISLVSRGADPVVSETITTRAEPAVLVDAPIVTTPPIAPAPSTSAGSVLPPGAAAPLASSVPPVGTASAPQAANPPTQQSAVAVRSVPDRPRTPSGRIVVRSTPLGARVSIDGRNSGVTPFTATVASGSHLIRVSQAGYVAAERRVSVTDERPSAMIVIDLARLPQRTEGAAVRNQVARRQTTPSAVPVAPLATTGSLVIDSRPPGAVVLVDGRAVGTTPLTLSAVAAAEHSIALDLRGFRRWSTSVRIVGGQQARVGASLERQ